MPVVGNGHMAMSVYNDSIFLDGVYNGRGEFSRRARIPAEAALRVNFSSSVTNIQRRFRFNLDTGVFEENITLPHCDIVHRTYCHKYYTRVFIQEIIMTPRTGQIQQCKLQLDHLRDNYTDDFEIFKKEPFNNADWTRRLRTHVAEGDGASPRDVYMFFDDIPRDLSLPRNAQNPQRNVFVMTLDTDRSRAERAYTEVQRVLSTTNGYNELYKDHLDAWRILWQYARIEIEGNVRLAKVTKAALYYMMSSLPPLVRETGGPQDTYQPANPFMGLARSGLGAGCNTTDYNGHVFWDHEMFMMPPMTILYPSIGKEMLMYRMNRRSAAKERASQTGNQGERFPWESAITGREITTSYAKFQQEYAHHITGAVGWAARNYYSATRDQEFMDSNGGCDFSKEIARFWQNKMKWNNTKARWDLNECQGPNDLHSYVNNNAYTNALATLSIQWARYVACLCRRNEKDEIPDEWMRRSVDLYMPYNDRYRRHDEFDDYEYRAGNQSLKQADTTLLHYPLGWNTTKEIMRNDLEFYEGKLNSNPPALTYSVHAIGWLRVPDKSRADSMFERSYSSYVQEPFKTWTEYPNYQGSVNFLPGMGGFLSTLLFGYAGIHIKPEEMMVYPPTLPPGVNTMRIYGVHYLGNSLEFEIQSSGVTLRNTGGDGKHQLRVRLNNTMEGGRPEEREFRQGSSIQATNTGLTIFSTTVTNCKPPDDTLRVRYSPVSYMVAPSGPQKLNDGPQKLISGPQELYGGTQKLYREPQWPQEAIQWPPEAIQQPPEATRWPPESI
ncbi:unnamed protein product [Owenia fusiformis]|uniref:Protein-glucosylgalactosylhydroxylysine glucosidase n=1 Tax=Owenia fusiformis TaxID=6347 RepID=A0A8J1Y295_OWEFU|nr:unnamed protein product [Owenia fusiformis]